MDVTVTGAAQLVEVARNLRAAGDPGKGLRKDLLRGIRKAAEPMKDAAKASAAALLPRRGGLAAQVSGGRFAVRTRTGGQTAGVRVVASGGLSLRALDAGRLRHPVYGHTDRWVTQSIRPGWFTVPVERLAPQIQSDVLAVMDDVARQVTR